MRPFVAAPIMLGAAVLIAACGDSTGPALDRNDPGTGTATLRVMAEIRGEAVSGGFITDLEAQIRDAQGDPVSGATVTIRNGDLGTVTLAEDGVGSGNYVASVNDFGGGDYHLDVVADTNRVEDVVVGGIGIHQITGPEPSDTLLADQPLTVTWSRSVEAYRAEVTSREYEAQDILDTGTHTIPGVDIQVRPDERVRVTRFNEVLPAGGLPGSRLQLRLRQTLEPLVVVLQ
jgi:hypothetical protein